MNRSRVRQVLGRLGGLGVGDLSETCVLDYWQGAWGLMGLMESGVDLAVMQ